MGRGRRRSVLVSERVGLRKFSELFAGPGDAGFDGGFGEAHNAADLAVAEIVDGFEEQGFAVAVGELRSEFDDGGVGFAVDEGCCACRGLGGMCVVGFAVGIGDLCTCHPCADFSCTGGGVSDVQGDCAEPGADCAGVADFVDFLDKGERDLLEEVVEIGPAGFVCEQDGGDPAAVVAPDFI